MEENEENYSPYCKICGACGEDGCCPASSCEFHKDGEYCKGYLRDLMFGYLMHKNSYHLLDADGKNKEEYDKIFDKYYDLIYRDNED